MSTLIEHRECPDCGSTDNLAIYDDLFLYEEGSLVWRRDGKVAGYTRKDGYVVINIKGRITYAHRIIFLLHHGYLPSKIDHIDGNPSNNRIENLREITTSQNLAVSEKSSAVSKYRGVSPYRGKWRASVSRDGVYKTKAGFETEEEAHQEYLKLRKSLYVELYTS